MDGRFGIRWESRFGRKLYAHYPLFHQCVSRKATRVSSLINPRSFTPCAAGLREWGDDEASPFKRGKSGLLPALRVSDSPIPPFPHSLRVGGSLISFITDPL